ncbi:MAG TPA: methyltransferase domain-containing protein, partial [Gaiellaceae bacterium]|nr:methyltransferase domain-containing protein [Gaiellaceae bacterium]
MTGTSETAVEALERWRSDLSQWGIPQEILDRAPAAPWLAERSVFVRRAAAMKAKPRGNSYLRANEALPSGGAVLDVGAGAGAASLPLLGRAGKLIAVDRDEEMLRDLVAQADADAGKVSTVVGAWPQVATQVPTVDVAVCNHVLYNVPDLGPFIAALDTKTRRRVVIEITARHPVARLNPLWRRFYGIERPTRPTWEDAVSAVEAAHGGPVHVEREQLPPEPVFQDWDEVAASTTRRLCLAPDRRDEV